MPPREDASTPDTGASEDPQLDLESSAPDAPVPEPAPVPEAEPAPEESTEASEPPDEVPASVDEDEPEETVISDGATNGFSQADREELDEIYRRARAAAEAGRLVEAEKGYREVLRRDPRHLKARNNLGYVYDSLGEPTRALEEYQAALEIEPENVQLLTNVGGALGTLGRYREADVHLNLGLVFFRKGLYDAARESLERAIRLDPECESAYYYLGEACNQLGQIDTALEALERAVTIQPGNGRAWYTMGILYDRKHEPEQATEAYLKARELLDAK
jgi:Tfp pilus assembly protein PilF